jgi:hypothetical protein
MVADVTDIVAASLARRDPSIILFIVAQKMQPSDNIIADAIRPVLRIRFHDPEKLCACKSSATPSISLTKLGARSGGAVAAGGGAAGGNTEVPTLICDRFCNLETQCKGHSCGFDTSNCKRAPFLLWSTLSPPGSLFQGVQVSRIANLSETNKAHVLERTGAPPDARRTAVTAGVGTGAHGYPTPSNLGETMHSLGSTDGLDGVLGGSRNSPTNVTTPLGKITGSGGLFTAVGDDQKRQSLTVMNNDSFASKASAPDERQTSTPMVKTVKSMSLQQAIEASGL